MTALRKVETEVQKASLADNFKQFFDVDFAVSREQKNAVYGVRYRVYCEEHKYEPADRFPNHMEQDEFDEKSLHCTGLEAYRTSCL